MSTALSPHYLDKIDRIINNGGFSNFLCNQGVVSKHICTHDNYGNIDYASIALGLRNTFPPYDLHNKNLKGFSRLLLSWVKHRDLAIYCNISEQCNERIIIGCECECKNNRKKKINRKSKQRFRKVSSCENLTYWDECKIERAFNAFLCCGNTSTIRIVHC